MIILRKDQLQVAPVESEIFNSRPAAFDFEKDGGLLFWWENINNPLWPW